MREERENTERERRMAADELKSPTKVPVVAKTYAIQLYLVIQISYIILHLVIQRTPTSNADPTESGAHHDSGRGDATAAQQRGQGTDWVAGGNGQGDIQPEFGQWPNVAEQGSARQTGSQFDRAAYQHVKSGGRGRGRDTKESKSSGRESRRT